MRKNQISKSCMTCGTAYSVKASRHHKSKYCSVHCKNRMASIKQKGRPMPDGCIKEPYGKYTRIAPAKKCGHLTGKGRNYCPACREAIMGRVTLACHECGKAFTTFKSAKNKYKSCSMSCRNKGISNRQKGEKSHLWRGGLTDQNMRIRNSSKTQEWRRAVFERDNYSCVSCGARGGRLCADHIKSFSLYPALRFDVDNGRTLCYPCHRKTDNFGYRAVKESEKYTNKLGQVQLCLM